MSRHVVTGAAAFIGSAIVDRLLAEAGAVVGVDDLSAGELQFLAPALAAELGTSIFESEEALLQRSATDVAVIVTTNASLSAVSARAIAARKHVLVEKPGGISVLEIERLEALARNHRGRPPRWAQLRLSCSERKNPFARHPANVFPMPSVT